MLYLVSEAGAQVSASPTVSFLAASPAPTAAQVIVPSTTLPPSRPIPSTSGGVQLAIYLCLLIALLGGGSYLMKNGFGFLQPKSKGARKLNVSETRILGNRQFLVVAEYEGRKMLLGVCPGRIELISDLGVTADEPFATRLSETP